MKKIIIISKYSVFTIIREGRDRYVLKSLNSKVAHVIKLRNVIQGIMHHRRNTSVKIIYA